MKTKLCLIVSLLLAALLLTSCATFRAPTPQDILRAELLKWKNFSAEGVMEVNYSFISLRKMFSVNKTGDEFRLDMLDGGIMGINPEPLMSLYMGPYLSLKIPIYPDLEQIAASLDIQSNPLAFLKDTDGIVSRYGNEIIANHKVSIGDADLSFNDRLQLTRIDIRDMDSYLEVAYSKKGDPDIVTFNLENKASLKLFVDSISYGQAAVSPLPKSQTAPLSDDLLKLMDKLLSPRGK